MKDASVTPHAVRHVEVIHGELFVLSLERNGLEFAPGDCVALHTDGEESRPYSIASGNREDTLRFLIRKMEGGEVSPWLMSRRPGDIVQVSPPFGWFRPAPGHWRCPVCVYCNRYRRCSIPLFSG